MTYGIVGYSGHQLLQGMRRLKLGAGGQVLSMSISNDGVTKVINTDAGGALIWNNTTSQWDQLITRGRAPFSTDFDDEVLMGGCYAIAVAPSDSTRIYMLGVESDLIGGLFPAKMYVSSNGGASFAVAGDWATISDMNPNGSDQKFNGPKIAVDPINPNVCIVTTDANGAFITTNGGTNWTAPTGLPTTSGTCHKGISFDTSSTQTGGRTTVVYAHSTHATAGVYKSTDGGSSFSIVSGGPATCTHGRCGIDGTYYIMTKNTTNLWRLIGSTWTDITPSVGWNVGNEGAVCPSLTNKDTLYISDDGGGMYYTTTATTTHGWSTRTNPGRTATDIPWLAATTENHMTTGDWVMDPITADKIWFCSGIGVFYTTAPQTATLVPWISQSVGIEELVTNQIVAPPGGYPLIANWDRAVFTITNPEAYPSNHGPSYSVAVNMGVSVDWASADSTFCVVLAASTFEDSSYSTDRGVTWHRFANNLNSINNGKVGGCIAASSSSTILWMEGNQGDVWYTRDKGASAWTKITSSNWGNNVADSDTLTITGMASNGAGAIRVTVASVGTLVSGQDVHFDQLSASGNFNLSFGTYNVTKISSTQFDIVGGPAPTGTFTSGSCRRYTGWNDASALYRFNLVADRVAADTFYLFNNGSTNNSGTPGFGGGFFKVTFPAGVLTIARQSFPTSPAIMGTPNAHNIKMVVDNNNAGHVFWSAGEGDSYTSGIMHSEDGCVTWQQVPAITQNRCMSLGAIKPGNDYSSVYFVGGLSTGSGYGTQKYGIYRSDSSKATWAANTPTWTLIGTFPLDCVSQIKTIAADPDVWGKFYLGTPCGGCFYYIP